MAITKTIGGDRVGSGKKMQAHLHNYNRSTHNLSEKWASSANCGILYPCLVKPAMRGDAFDIKINADARTIPTQGPLFGSFKFQIDVYQCPVRLYQSILHNNPQAIGLKMNQVKLPMLEITSLGRRGETMNDIFLEDFQFANNSLMKYLGASGLGVPNVGAALNQVTRRFNAIPALAYYDIFKTYYANKQEENAYVISPEVTTDKNIQITQATMVISGYGEYNVLDTYAPIPANNNVCVITVRPFEYINDTDIWNTKIRLGDTTKNRVRTLKEWNDFYKQITGSTYNFINFTPTNYYDSRTNEYRFLVAQEGLKAIMDNQALTYNVNVYHKIVVPYYASELKIKPFPLKNIDDMRYDILSSHTMGAPFVIKQNENPYLPYKTLVERYTIGSDTEITNNHYNLNGLVLKTYQNDIFNNWLNAEWIEGENGVNELSKVQVIDGKFSMDALSFAQKQYDMLNRIAVAGNTYEDWQDVVYEEVKRRQIESPIFIGGMSQEIYFDEIVQTSPAEGDPLGTLGGRGAMDLRTKKGGTIHVKCDEACFIIAIASLTPRIYQTQGNEFYMTELQSLDDFHKPAMDGIGFQDLIGERMAWFDTQINGGGEIVHRSKIGKLPAWIEYMTSVDKAYGDFAETSGKGYMILNRNYEFNEETRSIKDVTTYIDPTKYNYVFANTSLDAQNFWLEIHFDIKARRLMSARIMPNV